MTDIVERDIVERLEDCATFGAEGAEALCGEAAYEIKRLLSNAKQDAQYLLAYHRICQKHGIAPSSSDLVAALKENEP
jgi:hypothetical protein